IDAPDWKYRCSTLGIYMQFGGDISPPKPPYRYLSQGIPLKSSTVLLIDTSAWGSYARRPK
ncbi:hypothetical protein, partial [Bacteroides heparinolyticus]|uniref:hypothetical protein n=1 Tax=Prevotella heparinolytica TaxID=28113 RepID=UPI00359F5F5B